MKKRIVKGISIIESAVLIALVAIAGIGILTTFGGTVNETFQKSTIKFKSYEPFGFATASSSVSKGTPPSSDPVVGGGGQDGKVGIGSGDINHDPSPESSEDTSTTSGETFVGFGGTDGSSPGDSGFVEPSELFTPAVKDLVGKGGSDGSSCSGSSCVNDQGL